MDYEVINSHPEDHVIVSLLHKQVAIEKERNLRAYGMHVYKVGHGELWHQAARLKALGSISLADAFAAATAQMIGCELVADKDDALKHAKNLKLINIS